MESWRRDELDRAEAQRIDRFYNGPPAEDLPPSAKTLPPDDSKPPETEEAE